MFLMERLLLKFTKLYEAKFISHLDTMRTLHRAFRRAGLPITYSKGFNPHPSISVAAPLSLGIGSTAEYADVELDEFVDQGDVKDRLNIALPEGIKIINVLYIDKKMPTSMGVVEGANYLIKLHHNTAVNEVEGVIHDIMESKELLKNKRSKSGEKLVNIRPLIENIKLCNYNNNRIEIECLLLTGSRGSLGPEMIADILKEKSNGTIFGYPEIERKEIYCKQNNKWVDLLSYFSRK